MSDIIISDEGGATSYRNTKEKRKNPSLFEQRHRSPRFAESFQFEESEHLEKKYGPLEVTKTIEMQMLNLRKPLRSTGASHSAREPLPKRDVSDLIDSTAQFDDERKVVRPSLK